MIEREVKLNSVYADLRPDLKVGPDGKRKDTWWQPQHFLFCQTGSERQGPVKAPTPPPGGGAEITPLASQIAKEWGDTSL